MVDPPEPGSEADIAATKAALAVSDNAAAARVSPSAGEDPADHVSVAVGGGAAGKQGKGKRAGEVVEADRKPNHDLREALTHLGVATGLLVLGELQQTTLVYLSRFVGLQLQRAMQGLVAVDNLYQDERDAFNVAIAAHEREAKRIQALHIQAAATQKAAAEKVRELIQLRTLLQRTAGGNMQLGGYSYGNGGGGGASSPSTTPLAVARSRAEALAVQPWTLALTVRRWHQPNDWTARDRRRLCTDWLTHIAMWQSGTLKAGASPAFSARETLPLGGASIGIPSFIGVEAVRPALLSSIDFLFQDLSEMADSPAPSPTAPEAPIMTKSQIFTAVGKAIAKVPYALMALERRVRLTLLRIQTYEALFTTLLAAVAARKQMVRAHAAAGRKSLSDAPISLDIDVLSNEADVTGALRLKVIQALDEAAQKGMHDQHELLFSLGVEDVPTNGTMVALHNQAKMRQAATAFPHMLQALRELFPVGIIPEETDRLTRVLQLDQACRRHVHKKAIRKGLYQGLFPFGVDPEAEPLPPSTISAEDPATATVPFIPTPPLNTRLPDDSDAAKQLREWDITHCHGRDGVKATFMMRGCCGGGKPSPDDLPPELQAHIALVGLDLRVRTLLTCWSLEHARPFLVYSITRCQGALLNMQGPLPHNNARAVGDVVILVRATQAGLAQSAAECHYRVQVVNNHKDESIPVIVVGGNRAVKPPVVPKKPEQKAPEDEDEDLGPAVPPPPAPDLEATDPKAGLQRAEAQADALCELMLRRDVPLTYGGDGSSSIGQQLVGINQANGVPIKETTITSKPYISEPPKWSHPFVSAYAAFSNAADAVAFWRRRGHIVPEGHNDNRPSPRADVEDQKAMRPLGKRGPDSNLIVATVHKQEETIDAVMADTPFMPKDAVRLTYRLLLTVPWVDGFAPSRDYSSVTLLDESNHGLPLDMSPDMYKMRSDELKTRLHLSPPAVTHELSRGPYADLAICTLGPEIQFLHDPTALAAVHTNYQDVAKPFAFLEALGLASTPMAVVQSMRQYFGESSALLYSVMQRMRTDLTVLLVLMAIFRYGIIEGARIASKRTGSTDFILVQYVWAIFVVIILSSCFESAWSRRRVIFSVLWGERHPTKEQTQARQVAAKAAEAARARASALGGDPSREIMAAVTASGQMIGGPDDLPEEDRLIAAGSAYKPFYSRKSIVTQYLTVAIIILFQFAGFAGSAYAAWWVQDQKYYIDKQMEGILTPAILFSGSALSIVLGDWVFEWTREWSPCTGQRAFRSIGTANPTSHGVWTALPAGMGASQVRRMYTRSDERHDFIRTFIIRFIPHFTTTLYLAVVDANATGGKLSYPQLPFEAAGWQLLGMNVVQVLVELFFWVYGQGWRRRKRRDLCGNPITAIFGPCISRPSDHRLPWFLWFLRHPLVIKTKEGQEPILTPSCNVDPSDAPNTDGVRDILPPFLGSDKRGPWGTPPIVGADGVRRVMALFQNVRAKKELPALSSLTPQDPNTVVSKEDIIMMASADAMGRKAAAPPLMAIIQPDGASGGGAAGVQVDAAPAKAPLPATSGSSVVVGDPSTDAKWLFGVVGDNENAWMEVTAEKIVEARAAVGNAVQSRAALAQVYGHWWCMQVPGVDSAEMKAKLDAQAKALADAQAAEEAAKAEEEAKKKAAEEAAAEEKRKKEEEEQKKKEEEEKAKKKEEKKGKKGKGQKKPGDGKGNKAGKEGKGKPGAGGGKDEGTTAGFAAVGGGGAEMKGAAPPANAGAGAVQPLNVGQDKAAAPAPQQQAPPPLPPVIAILPLAPAPAPAAGDKPAANNAAANGADKAVVVGPVGVPGPTHKPNAGPGPQPPAAQAPAAQAPAANAGGADHKDETADPKLPALTVIPPIGAIEKSLNVYSNAGKSAQAPGDGPGPAVTTDPIADAMVHKAVTEMGRDDFSSGSSSHAASLYRYLVPQRDMPAEEAAMKYFNLTGDVLTNPNLFPTALMASRAASMPLIRLPPFWEAQHQARILFIVSNVLIASILQPWFCIMAAPLMFYIMDNYVDMTQTQAVRRYPTRVLNDFFSVGYTVLTYVAIFVSVIIMSRNPITLLDLDWNTSTFKAPEYIIAVIGAFVLASGARFCIRMALDRNMFANRLCCGRKAADFVRVKNYLGYIEEELFDKASRMQAELINAHRVAGDRCFNAYQGSMMQQYLLKRMESISTAVFVKKEAQAAVNVGAPAAEAPANPAPQAAAGGDAKAPTDAAKPAAEEKKKVAFVEGAKGGDAPTSAIKRSNAKKITA